MPASIAWISVFETAATDQDGLTDTVTSEVSFCEDKCVLTNTFWTYNINKPCQSKAEAYGSEGGNLYNQARNTLNKRDKSSKEILYWKCWQTGFQLATVLQCREAWSTLPATGNHHRTLWKTINSLTTWKCFTSGLISLHSHLSPFPTSNNHKRTLTPSHLHTGFVNRMCASSSGERWSGKHPDGFWKSMLTSGSPSLQRSSTDHWTCMKFTPASNAPQSSTY